MASDINLARKKLSTILNDEGLVDKYLQKFGPEINIKNIKQIKKISGELTQNSLSESGISPVFEIKIRCPVCQTEGFTLTEMKAKSQSIVHDRFMNPIYSGTSGFQTVDYNREAIAVCPKCFFASSNKKDFVTYSLSTRSEVKSQLDSSILLKLKKSIDSRVALVPAGINSKDYFKSPKTTEAVILSYELAVLRAEIEVEMDLAYSLYKVGTYSLRIARVQMLADISNEKHLKKALKFYQKSYRISNIPNQDLENQMIYVIVALCLRLKDEKGVQDYLQILEKIKKELTEKMVNDPKISLASIDLWLKKAKTLWEDREMPDLWQ